MFQRKPLREDVQTEIHQRIVDGRLPAGSRINETHLAAELGLSRTPLREAMLTMAARGLLVANMGRGFAVPALSRRVWRDVQEVLRGLEPAALVMAAAPPPTISMELGNLLQRSGLRFSGPDLAATQTTLVTRFSRLALDHTPNRIMREEISRLQAIAAPFWFAAGQRGQPGPNMLSSYRELYELIRTGRLEEAGGHWAEQTDRLARSVAAAFPEQTDI